MNGHFQLRTCTDHVLSHRRRPCILHQIHRCPAPCVYELPEGEYRAGVEDAVAFLEGREPVKLEGELVADAANGAPLRVQIRAAFRVKGDPETRAEVELSAQVKAVGAAVAAVSPPKDVLPDERKTRGVARAMEAAGLRKRGQAAEEEEAAEESE